VRRLKGAADYAVTPTSPQSSPSLGETSEGLFVITPSPNTYQPIPSLARIVRA
jgi:hypothetical protein